MTVVSVPPTDVVGMVPVNTNPLAYVIVLPPDTCPAPEDSQVAVREMLSSVGFREKVPFSGAPKVMPVAWAVPKLDTRAISKFVENTRDWPPVAAAMVTDCATLLILVALFLDWCQLIGLQYSK